MSEVICTISIITVVGLMIFIYNHKRKDDGYNRNERGYNKKEKANGKTLHSPNPKQSEIVNKKRKKYSFFKKLFDFRPKLPFDDQSIEWVSGLVGVDREIIQDVLRNISVCYTHFRLAKRSGGYRVIASPDEKLMDIQRIIYMRILLPVAIHPAATGFRPNVSIVDNARQHLGKDQILKIDIQDFFGSVKLNMVADAFQKIGYPDNISKLLAYLCCLNKCLPQGAPTSPSLSNIVVYEMDKEMSVLAKDNNCVYTRYADDLTFSGDSISKETLLLGIEEILKKRNFILNRKKTRYIVRNRRKIITGVSISSGLKITIPKAKKREVRKNIHFILTRGLSAHQQHIGSSDPAYLQRMLGYLSFWLSVEPDNQYVVNSIVALRKLKK